MAVGAALAARGYIAVAVNHPGNNELAGYTTEGISLWWLRAVDLGCADRDAVHAETVALALDFFGANLR